MEPMPHPDPRRLADLIVELRRTLRRSSRRSPSGEDGPPSGTSQGRARTPTEQEVLRYVAAHPGSGTSTIAAALRLRANTVSGLCSGLVSEGSLVRETDPVDGRVARFVLSSTAASRREGKMENRSDRLGEALERLDPDQQRRISAAIPALEALVERLDEEGIPE